MQRQATKLARPPTTRYLCVDLGAEHYAIPILTVREIQAYGPPTPLPRMPAHVRGVTNLHGDIVPVVDLRLRIGMAEQTYGRLTVIVFVAIASHVVGLIVDAASRVIDLEAAQIRPPPEMADGVDVSFIAGIAKPGDLVIVVLDVEALLRGDPALAASVVVPSPSSAEHRRDSQ
jgi:purine-binding chemotaxis protein CheW